MSILGVGSGRTVVYCVKRISEKVKRGEIEIKACIPTSFQAKEMIINAGLPLGELNQYPVIDILFDGADEVDEDLNCIKGGGGCHFQEKLIANASKLRVMVADAKKLTKKLGTYWTKGVPVEVHPMAYINVSKEIKKLGGNPILRYASTAKAGPLITDNGNFILDTVFPDLSFPRDIEQKLKCIAGVIEVGIFTRLFDFAYLGFKDGHVEVKTLNACPV